MRLFTILLLLFFFQLNAQQKAYYQQHVKYDMKIDVDAENYTYQGSQSIEYTNNSPDQLDVVYFHLYWNAFQPNSMMDQRVQKRGANGDSRLFRDGQSRLSNIPQDQQGAQNIHWIKQNSQNLKFEIQGTIMKVYLNQPIAAKSKTNFEMEWDAVVPQQIRRSGRNNSEGIEMTMTQWYPKLAEYDYDGWAAFDYVGREFHAPFSDYNVKISINSDYVVGAGGTLENPKEVKGYQLNASPKIKDGKATWHWTANNILDFAWAADPDYTVEKFDVLDGPTVYYVFQKSEKTAYWEPSKSYIKKFFTFMNAQFGIYPYPTYSFIQGGDGGMEYGQCTMILGEASSLESLVGLMVHEGGHSWNQQILAYNESVRPWMDEGFTSYFEDLAMSQLFPGKKIPNPFVNSIDGYRNFVKTGKEEPAVWFGDHHDNGRAYSYASYVKGELFLVQLGYIVGENNLSLILKEFYNQWKLKHPTDRDFMHIAQKYSKMDLKWFHHYWINTTKTIDYGIQDVKFGEDSTTITLVNKGEVPMPIDFAVFTKENKIINYQIPLNLTRTWKNKDIFGEYTTLDYWPWTQSTYTFTIPYTKEQIGVLGIDLSQRLADVDIEDNFIEYK